MMKGMFGLLPTPYHENLEIHTEDLKAVANFCCESGQHGIVWPAEQTRGEEEGSWPVLRDITLICILI